MDETDQEIEIIIGPNGVVLWWGVWKELEEVSKQLGREAYEQASNYCG